jgi:hypothetical protein
MKHHRVFLALFSLLFFSAVVTPQTTSTDQDARKHRFLAITFLRAVNTAEANELNQHGSYATWQTLQAHQSASMNKFLQQYQGTGQQFAAAPDILPGWTLRFELHADGKGYDVRLADLTDTSCSYAALSDESGLIRQSKALDCPI